jgi:hypothetical protein
MGFQAPEDRDRFITQLRAELEAAGLSVASERLAAIQARSFATGAEWLAELGLAVKDIRATCVLPTPLETKLEKIMVEVHRVERST